ncbi:hypothetical protein L2E82_31018 [Cichorium intybus]|uniref:Uncharacterized protein n=1 Tax=Cichorium intybus TaxID=13427 RepID=A0ACB9D206_CICIN|nr:hypothetical protein L2E82_31018 [Cichorium intybus]
MLPPPSEMDVDATATATIRNRRRLHWNLRNGRNRSSPSLLSLFVCLFSGGRWPAIGGRRFCISVSFFRPWWLLVSLSLCVFGIFRAVIGGNSQAMSIFSGHGGCRSQ